MSLDLNQVKFPQMIGAVQIGFGKVGTVGTNKQLRYKVAFYSIQIRVSLKYSQDSSFSYKVLVGIHSMVPTS